MDSGSGERATHSGDEPPSMVGNSQPLEPDPGEEHLFVVENNPFAFSPGQLSKLMDPKSLPALQALGGIKGLERGLRTDLRSGLSLEETHLPDVVTFQGATVHETGKKKQKGQKRVRPHAARQEVSLASPQPPASHGHPNDCYVDRKRIFQEHLLPERKSKSFLQLAWLALHDQVLVLLSVAAVVSLALGLYQTFGPRHDDTAKVEWIEGVAIVVAILIVVLVSALNDWQKERQFRRLNQKKEDRTVKVVRSGKPSILPVHDLLVGDVMILEQGDVIPVDGVLIEGHTVSCDESSATGESDLVKKTPAQAVEEALGDGTGNPVKLDPFMISGSKVLDGVGSFLVTAVGPNSSHGRTMMSLRDDPEMTPLQAKLSILAGYIAKLGGAAGLLLFTVLFIEFLARLPTSTATPTEKGQTFLRILITSITIIVVAVPEGLPLAVTLSLAFATKKMTKVNNLVRHLQSCETMGNATVICSDKTGTLTENVMTVVAGALGAGSLEFSNDVRANLAIDHGHGSDKKCEPVVQHVSASQLSSSVCPELGKLIKDSIAINTTAFEGEDGGKSSFIGTKTETALLDFARSRFAMGPLAVERANHPVLQIFPFNSREKCMGTVICTPNATRRLLIKGAPEVILAQCTTSILSAPTATSSALALAPLSSTSKNTISTATSHYATLSLRTIALAYRDLDPSTTPDETATLESLFHSLTWLAVLAIQDPVRPGVPAAVATCNHASVAVKMVTGDNVETACAVARECGILPPLSSAPPPPSSFCSPSPQGEEAGLVMEGAEFRRLGERERRARVRKLCVLARSSPEDKRVLVTTLRGLGEVVAVTGDGTNDAPALRAADVGFSMGIAGTEVAREASDIVLMDDNFASLVQAVAWGRAINDSVRKFLQFQITVNITAVVLTFVSAVASGDEKSVLNAVQLLWVNLIMDTFAALALATDSPTESLLDRAPDKRTAPLITLTMWKMILGQVVYQLAVAFTLHFAVQDWLEFPKRQHRTLVFNAFVFMQIFKLINGRRIDNKLNIFEGLHKNTLFIVMMLIMIVGQVIIVFFGGAAFDVARLTVIQWAISIVVGFLSIVVGILIRLIPDAWMQKVVDVVSKPWRKQKNVSKLSVDGAGLEDALLQVEDHLAFLKRVRGGRIKAMGRVVSGKFAPSRPRTPSGSISPMQSAVGMPGLLAATVGGLSPLGGTASVGAHGRMVPGI